MSLTIDRHVGTAISCFLTILTVSSAIHIVPDLLHPLFGSIPVNLHLDHVVWSLFFLQVLLHGSLPASSTKLDIDINLAPVLLGIDLMVAVRAYKKVARIAGNLGGSVGGAVGTFIVLLGPVIVLGTGTFVHNAVSRSRHAPLGMQ
jgi:hypothetical protein